MTTPHDGEQMASTGRSPAPPTGEMTGHGSAVISTPAAPAQVQPAAEVLDGELITDAEYARRRGLHYLPVLAVVAVIRGSDRTQKITGVVVPWIMRPRE